MSKGILMIGTFGVQVKAHSHDDEIGNKTSNNNRWHDVGLRRCNKRQSFDVSSGSNNA